MQFPRWKTLDIPSLENCTWRYFAYNHLYTYVSLDITSHFIWKYWRLIKYFVGSYFLPKGRWRFPFILILRIFVYGSTSYGKILTLLSHWYVSRAQVQYVLAANKFCMFTFTVTSFSKLSCSLCNYIYITEAMPLISSFLYTAYRL